MAAKSRTSRRIDLDSRWSPYGRYSGGKPDCTHFYDKQPVVEVSFGWVVYKCAKCGRVAVFNYAR